MNLSLGADAPRADEPGTALRLVAVEEADGIVRVMCRGEMSFFEFREDPNPLVSLLGPGVFSRRVLLNLGEVGFLDTTGISWLLSCHARFRERGGGLVLSALPPQVHRMLHLLDLDQVFVVAASDGEARDLLRQDA